MQSAEKYGFLVCLVVLICFAIKDRYVHAKNMNKVKLEEKEQG